MIIEYSNRRVNDNAISEWPRLRICTRCHMSHQELPFCLHAPASVSFGCRNSPKGSFHHWVASSKQTNTNITDQWSIFYSNREQSWLFCNKFKFNFRSPKANGLAETTQTQTAWTTQSDEQGDHQVNTFWMSTTYTENNYNSITCKDKSISTLQLK